MAVFESLESGSSRNGEMLVTGKISISQSFKDCADISQVSDSKKTRDCLRVLVGNSLDERVKLIELDYQPSV